MSVGSDRASFVHRYGNTPQTHTVISSRSKIYAHAAGSKTPATMEQVGVLNKFSVSQSREVTPVSGIGYGDIIAELVPGRQGPIQIQVNRAALYLMNIFQSFGYQSGIDGLIRALRHHRWPFDIMQEIILSERVNAHTNSAKAKTDGTWNDAKTSAAMKAMVTLYESCWMTSHSADYSVDSATVMEDVAISATDMVDFAGGNKNRPGDEGGFGGSPTGGDATYARPQ